MTVADRQPAAGRSAHFNGRSVGDAKAPGRARSLVSLIKRHLQAFWYVATVILPICLRTRARPVIFSRYAGMGDIICSFPTALELQKRHPRATFIYNCDPNYVCLPRLGKVTECVTSLRPIGLVGYWWRFLLSGYYNFGSNDDKPDVVPTEIYIRDYGTPFGVSVEGNHPCLVVHPEVVSRVRKLLDTKDLFGRPLVVIHPGPSWPVREWPRDSWRALINALKSDGYTNLVQLGTAAHLTVGATSTGVIPGAVSLVGELTLEETVALISIAGLFIGIDSGPLHIAACVGTPSVGIWGATSPGLRFATAVTRAQIISGVECQGCQHRFPRPHWETGCPFDIRCMKAIGVEEVLNACLPLLRAAVLR